MIHVAADAWSYVWKLGLVALVLITVGWWEASLLPILLLLFVLFFFRDPERLIPLDPLHAVSPADGTVMRIDEIPADPFIGGPARKVVIFLSVFNVHINRAPVAGKVALVEYKRGEMLAAYKPEASEVNERNTIGIRGEKASVKVNQITGLIARRIVCNVKEGDDLAQGQRYGLIKFGSCTELVVPASATILVKPGDKVAGGETVLARF